MNLLVSESLNLRKQCEELLRQGQFLAVQKKLQKLSAAQIPRHELAPLAALARRSHLWKLSLRWLHPIVRPAVQCSRDPSSREVAEYAMALQKAGALSEADQLLSSLDASDDPRILLSKAFLRFARWDYASAEPLLSAYIKSPLLSDYERLIGQVNWLATLVYLQDPRAADYQMELEKQLRTGQHWLLLANTFEISAQQAVADSNWNSAKEFLKRAQQIVDQEKNLDALFIEKWQTIVSALEAKDPIKLSSFRPRALAHGHWETLRDLDYYHALLSPESIWSNWVYFGTPHQAFRKRLEKFKQFGTEEWIRRTPQADLKVDPWFPGEPQGDLSHRCFVLLLQDLYRPLRVGEAFGSLFPGEYYNPNSSPNRVYQTMTRLRRWLKDLNLPFRLIESEGAYSLRAPDNIQLLGRKQTLCYEENHFLFHRYCTSSETEFTTEELAAKLGRSKSTLRKTIRKALEIKVLEKHGQGRFTSYKIIPSGND